MHIQASNQHCVDRADRRDINRSVDDLFKWQQQKKVRLMEKSMEFEHDRRECKFAPEISPHSKAIMKKRTNNNAFQKVEDRLLSYINKNKDLDKKEEADKLNASHKTCNQQKSRPRGLSQSIAFGRRLAPAQSVQRSMSRIDDSTSGRKSASSHTFRSRNKTGSTNQDVFSFRKGLDSLGRRDQDRDTPQLFRQRQGQHRFEDDLPAVSHEVCKSRHQDSTLLLDENTFAEEKATKSPNKQPAWNSTSAQSNKENAYRPYQPMPSIPCAEHDSHRSLNRTAEGERHGSQQTRCQKGPTEGATRPKAASKTSASVLNSKPSKSDPIKTLERSMSRSSVLNTPAASNKQLLARSKTPVATRTSPPPRPAEKQVQQPLPATALVKPNKGELTEKYGVKVKKQTIDCRDIRQSVFAGATPSMLENLKRVNTNLRKFNQFECIIKDNKQSDTRSTHAQSLQSVDESVLVAEAVGRHRLGDGADRNPFIELLEVSGLCPPN